MINNKRIALALIIAAIRFTGSNSQQIRTCTNINNNIHNLERIIQNDTDGGIKLICPFKIYSNNAVNIYKSDVSIVCAKEKSDDSCLFNGPIRHINIVGERVSLVGFDFKNAKNAAVKVFGASASFIDCSFHNNKRLIDEGEGGAIELDDNSRNAFIIGSQFQGNYADDGGALFSQRETDTTIVSTLFEKNSSNRGGALALISGKIISNQFMMNTAMWYGSSIFIDGTDFCDGGDNYACTGLEYTDTNCDGIFYNGHQGCNNFSDICDYPTTTPSSIPSNFPSFYPSEFPSALPSKSSSPSISLTSMPFSEPSLTPSQTPSSNPTAKPSKSVEPSLIPTQKPTSTSSMLPTVSPTSQPTTDPTVLPTMLPSVTPSLSPSVVKSGMPSTTPTLALSLTPTETQSSTPSSSIKPSLNPSQNPSGYPTVSLQPSYLCNLDPAKREQLIMEKLLTYSNQSRRNLQQIEGYLQKAFFLLVHHDSICPDDANLLQRFIAGATVIALEQDHLLSNESECKWKGIKCNHDGKIVQINIDGPTGKIPQEISFLTDLRSLTLENGSLNTIPSSILELQNLQNLDVDFNKLEGSLPSSNSRRQKKLLSKMLRVDLNFNSLTSGLEMLSHFPNLKEAHLDFNKFKGKIPKHLGNLTNLRILTLHGNSFTGTMPESICKLRDNGLLYVLSADCHAEAEKVKCSCCTHCYKNV